MPDRDRLAADLHAAHLGCRLDYRGDVDCGGGAWPCHTDPADRLIALGWTRECEHCDPRHEWPCPTILRCDEPGCEREATCGWPTRGIGTSPKAGYRRTCGDHYREGTK